MMFASVICISVNVNRFLSADGQRLSTIVTIAIIYGR